MKRKIILVLIVIAALMITSLEIIPLLLQYSGQDSQKNILVASHIYDCIDAAVEKPKIIARTMSSDSFLKNTLRNEGNCDEKAMEEIMSSYLSSISQKFGYIAAFVISENTRRYYTPKGISKTVNPQNDPYDIWYQLFLDSKKDLDLDTDRDQENDYRWTVFINARITDSDGSLMGVCGVGLFMDDLQELILQSEREYGVKINLIEKDGLVQVDTDVSNIENAYISEAVSDNACEDSFTYTKRKFGGFRATRYMKELEWYLVVQGFGQDKSLAVTKVSVFILYILFFSIFLVIFIGSKRPCEHNLIKPSSPEDILTGLPNRNYLKEAYGELGVFNTTRYKSLVMFDIDRFKTVNEERDGDKIILGIVDLTKQLVGEEGIIFRWSGDEFVVFLEMDADEAEEKFKKFCIDIKESLDVTVSVGIVEIDLSESIKTNYHRAVQPCYAVKEAGGNGVGRK